jgi:hypothetical protein
MFKLLSVFLLLVLSAAVFPQQPVPQPATDSSAIQATKVPPGIKAIEKTLDSAYAIFKGDLMREFSATTTIAKDSFWIGGGIRQKATNYDTVVEKTVSTDSTTVISVNGKVTHLYYKGGEKIKSYINAAVYKDRTHFPKPAAAAKPAP